MKENKSSGAYTKVTMFPGTGVNLADAVIDDAMDEALRESIKREADELEARLNNDPAMKGIGASEDMFEKIVASLKEMGVWEEEETDGSLTAERETCTLESEKRLEGEKPASETGDIAAEKTLSEIRSEKRQEQDLELGKKSMEPETMGEKAETVCGAEIGQAEQISSGFGNESEKNPPEQESGINQIKEKMEMKDREEKNVPETNSGNGAALEKDTTLEDENSAIDKEADQKATEIPEKSVDGKDLEILYQLLPEEDRKALELGYRVKREKEERGRRQRKRFSIIKRVGIVAASVVVVFSVSMTGEANRRLVSRVWGVLRENLGMRTAVNYIEIENFVESRDEAEYQAMQDIHEKLGISSIYFGYLPDTMEFLNYEIQLDWDQAILFYKYNDAIMSVQIIKNTKDRASYFQLDEATGETEFVESNQDIKIKLQEAGDEEEKAYLAQFEENDCTCVINGIIEYSEMKKIIKNIIIFEN